jgi:hypothetical protein
MPTIPDDFKYIPSLNLYHDEENNVFYNEGGYIIDVSKRNKRITDKPSMWNNPPDIRLPVESKNKSGFSLENLNLSASSVFQIVAICVAISTQYNIIENKIKEFDYKLDNIKAIIAEKDVTIQALNQELKQIKAQMAISDNVIDNMQYRLSNIPPVKK